MRHLPVAGKALSLLFAAIVLAACSSSDTQEQGSTDAQQTESARQEQIAAQQQQQARADQMRWEEVVADHGNVFYFDFDSYTLRPEALDALNAHIGLLQDNDRTVRLEGHTDERGTREYNMALGERRANSVRDYMVANGIASYRIETVSYGEERPVAYGSGEANWSQNRRVELK